MDSVRHWSAAVAALGLTAASYRNYSDFGGGRCRDQVNVLKSEAQKKRIKAKKARKVARRNNRK